MQDHGLSPTAGTSQDPDPWATPAERTPQAYAAHAVLGAIIRGWRDRSVDEGLTETDLEEQLIARGLAAPADLQARLMGLEIDGFLVCDPGTSQRAFRLRGFPQPLLDELDRLRYGHEKLLDQLEERMTVRGDESVALSDLRVRVEEAVRLVEELQACLAGGLEGRRRYLERRAAYDPAVAEALEAFESACARAHRAREALQVAADARVEQLSPAAGQGLSVYVGSALEEARLRLTWGRAEQAVRQLTRARELVELS